MRLGFLFFAIFMSCLVAMGTTERPLNNEDIDKLVTAQIDSSLIIRLIEANSSDFNTSPQALQKLKDKGASQDVLDEMSAAKVTAKRNGKGASATGPVSAPFAMTAKLATNPFPAFEEFSCNITELSECPVQGCAHDEDHALFNEVKRHIPTASTAASLDFQDFAVLQADVEKAGIEVGGEISVADRNKLKHLQLPKGRTVSEQDLVQVVGYLVGKPHPNKGESVNCSLHGTANNDIHIPIAEDSDKTDFEGVVVEMIPQDRDQHQGWNVATLNKVKAQKRQVLIRGQLFLDNEHVVNEDEEQPIGGQPARMSLWEVHPVTNFLVCNHAGTCSPENKNEWTELASFAGAH